MSTLFFQIFFFGYIIKNYAIIVFFYLVEYVPGLFFGDFTIIFPTDFVVFDLIYFDVACELVHIIQCQILNQS